MKTAAHKNFKAESGDDDLIAEMRPEYQQILKAAGSYSEIAAKLEIPLGTVRSRLNRGRTLLVAMRGKKEQK